MPDTAESPALAALRAAAVAGDAAAVEQWWEATVAAGTPLVEPIAGDPDGRAVTFLWRAAGEPAPAAVYADVLCVTDPSRPADGLLQRVDGTDIWARSYRLAPGWRGSYTLAPLTVLLPPFDPHRDSIDAYVAHRGRLVAGAGPDPHNRRAPIGGPDGPRSVVELAGAPGALPDRAATPTASWLPVHLDGRGPVGARTVHVLEPSEQPPTGGYGLIVVLDAEMWDELGCLGAIVDDLRAGGDLGPSLVVTVPSGTAEERGRDLGAVDDFARLVAVDLPAALAERWPVCPDPERSIIAGQSLGGLAATHAAVTHPGRFGRVVSQSGAFASLADPREATLAFVDDLARRPAGEVRFRLEVGSREWMLLEANRHVADVLTAAGWQVELVEFDGGHDRVCWMAMLADALADRRPAGRVTVTGSDGQRSDERSDEPPTTGGVADVPPQLPRTSAPVVADSPRIARLRAERARDGVAAVERFWSELEVSGTPLVEPGSHDGERVVTFVWRGGDHDEVVVMANKHTDPSTLTEARLERLDSTDVWWRSFRVPSDWRAGYRFGVSDPGAGGTDTGIVSDHWRRQVERARAAGSTVDVDDLESWARLSSSSRLDPHNRRQLLATSVASMPDAPPLPPPVPDVAPTEHLVASARLGEERRVWVHVPPGPPTAPDGVLVMLDGDRWREESGVLGVVDRLAAAGGPRLCTLVVDAVDHERRIGDLTCNDAFVDFVADELLDRIAAEWSADPSSGSGVTWPAAPSRVIVAGQSLGGLTAAYAAWRRPDRIGNAIAQSGSFWWPNAAGGEPAEWLTHRLARSARRDVRFAIEVGTEEWALLLPTRRLRNVLAAKGYDVHYSEYCGGHDRACWHASIAQLLDVSTSGWR